MFSMDQQIILGIGWFAVFLFSTTCHEASHALIAYRLGDPTAYHGGQVSLNPLPHIRREPFGMVIVPILSFILYHFVIGWASAPYDPNWAREHPRRSALMALAGPLANLLLVVISGLFIRIGLEHGWFVPSEIIFSAREKAGAFVGLALLLRIFFILNSILLCFNLLPLPPLDGGSVVTLLMPVRHALNFRDFMSQPTYSLIGLIVAWNLFPRIFGFVFPLLKQAVFFNFAG